MCFHGVRLRPYQQVQQHSNGAAAAAIPTRSPIVYYASSSAHPTANNPVHQYFGKIQTLKLWEKTTRRGCGSHKTYTINNYIVLAIAYSTTPPTIPTVHNPQPAVPTYASLTVRSENKGWHVMVVGGVVFLGPLLLRWTLVWLNSLCCIKKTQLH